MDFLQLMQTRYTTKKYDATKHISNELIEKLKEILRLSPSSINSQPWQFTFISDPKLKHQLAFHSYFNKEKIENASHLVVFSSIDNVDLFAKMLHNLSEGAINYYNQNLKQLPEEMLKMWFTNQVYLALGIFLAGCASLGIDSTAMEGIDKEAYNKVLNNKDYKVALAVAIGYRDKDDANQLHLKPKQRHNSNEIIVEKK